MPPFAARLAQFTTDKDPLADQAVEVLCEDHNGTYTLPFLCRLQAGVWLNAGTGHAVEAAVVGWRVKKGWGRSNV
jgi:hypothetical protein